VPLDRLRTAQRRSSTRTVMRAKGKYSRFPV
jgi:hypothetical protein